jgi:hypothetical protein
MRFAPIFTPKFCHECKTHQITAIVDISMKNADWCKVQNWCKSSAIFTRASVIGAMVQSAYIYALHLCTLHRDKKT